MTDLLEKVTNSRLFYSEKQLLSERVFFTCLMLLQIRNTQSNWKKDKTKITKYVILEKITTGTINWKFIMC